MVDVRAANWALDCGQGVLILGRYLAWFAVCFKIGAQIACLHACLLPVWKYLQAQHGKVYTLMSESLGQCSWQRGDL